VDYTVLVQWQREPGPDVFKYSDSWFRWAHETLRPQPGLVSRWPVDIMGFFASEREKRTLYRGDLLNLAGFQGDLRMVRWLMEEGECHSVVTMAITALGGNLAVLEYLKSQGCPTDEWTWTGAACGGHLHILKWLRSNGTGWDAGACGAAACGGHLGVVKWLREHGCEWNERVCVWASQEGRIHVLEWARSQNPPAPWNKDECIHAAEGHEQHEVVRWISRQK